MIFANLIGATGDTSEGLCPPRPAALAAAASVWLGRRDRAAEARAGRAGQQFAI